MTERGPLPAWFVVVGIAMVIGVAWPVSLDLAIAAAVWGVLVRLSATTGLGEGRWATSGDRLKAGLLHGLRDAAACAVVALAIVCCAQIALRVCRNVRPESVCALELSLVDLSDVLKAVLGLRFTAAVLAGCVLLVFVRPRSRFVTRFLALRKWTGRLGVVLLILTSFTFFSARAASNLEAIYVARMKPRLRELADTLDSGRRELVALAATEEASQSNARNRLGDLAAFIERAGTAPDSPEAEVVTRQARAFVAEAPAVRVPELIALVGPDDEDDTTVARKMADEGSEARASELSAELVECDDAQLRLQEAVAAARQTANSAFKTALKLPKTGTLADVFFDTLVGELVKSLVNTVVPASVSDLESAKRFLQARAAEGYLAASLRGRPLWAWSLPREGTEPSGAVAKRAWQQLTSGKSAPTKRTQPESESRGGFSYTTYRTIYVIR